MKLPSLVIFDMDGLIFDSERLFMSFLQKTMREYGYHLTEAQYIRTLGISKTDCVAIMKDMFGRDYPALEISNRTRAELNAYGSCHPIPEKPGIRSLLAFLQQQDIPCCVASSSPKSTVELYLRQAELSSYFDFVQSGDDLTHSKPNPEIFLKCLEHYQISGWDALVLEDSEAGIRASAAAGIPVICIPDMKEPSPECQALCLLKAPDAFRVCEYLEKALAG